MKRTLLMLLLLLAVVACASPEPEIVGSGTSRDPSCRGR